MLSLTVLGCSGSYASASEACSGYLVQTETTSIWVDCGPGTLSAIQRWIDPTRLDAIVVSHQHPDHCAELPVFYNALKWYLGGKRMPVYAASGVFEVSAVHVPDLTDVFDWTVIDATSQVRIGDVDVSFDRTDHTVETLACRFDSDGRSIVYTSDTGPGWDPSGLAADADVLLGDATVLHDQVHDGLPHMSARQLAEAATRARVGELVLTHLAPGSDPAAFMQEATEHFGGPIGCASGGVVVVAGRHV
ncbi:MAG: MBL fold metallo-hydrolase [Acidimicrobiales bacterium]